MGKRSFLALAGAVIAGVTLSGCETGRPFADGRSFFPSPFNATGSFAQCGKPMAPPGTQPAFSYVTMTLKPDGTAEPASVPVEVNSSLQLVNANQGNSATPMLAITVPSMKLLMPIRGTYSYQLAPLQPVTSNASVQNATSGRASTTMQPKQAENTVMRVTTPPSALMHHPADPPPMIPEAATGAAPLPPAPIPYPVSPVPNQESISPSAGPSKTGPPPPVSYLPPVAPAPPSKVEENILTPNPTSMEPPPPSWPMTDGQSESTTASDSNPPPPPLIHRQPR